MNGKIFPIGAKIYAVYKDQDFFMTETPPSPLDEKYQGYTVVQIGVSLGEQGVLIRNEEQNIVR